MGFRVQTLQPFMFVTSHHAPAGAERGAGVPASDGEGGSGGAKPPGQLMTRNVLLLGLVASLTISCSREGSQPAPAAAPAPAPKPLTAGVDPSGFDKTVRPQDDLYKFVNGAWLAEDRNPTRPRRLWRVLRGHRPDAGETPRHRGRGLEDGEQGARIRSAEARRLLRSVHGRGPRQPAGKESARAGARANRCAREQDRPGAPHGAHADAEHDDARRRRSGRRRTGSQDVRSLSVAERPRPPRSRLLPQSRPEAEGVPGRSTRRTSRRCSRSPDSRHPTPPPRRSSPSRHAWRARIGRTSRAAMRSRPTTR